jgi:hypothetical protein
MMNASKTAIMVLMLRKGRNSKLLRPRPALTDPNAGLKQTAN